MLLAIYTREVQIDVAGDHIASLTLALRLHLKRHDVRVVAHHEQPQLPDSFALPAPYRDLFLKTGAAMESVLPLVEVAPLADIDRRHAVMGLAARIWGEVRTCEYRSSRTLRATLREIDGRTREAVLAHATGHSLDADRIGDAALVLPYLDATFGRWRFEGGLSALQLELHARCERLGVGFGPARTGAREVGTADIDAVLNPMFSVQRRWRNDLNAPSGLSGMLGLPFIGIAAETVAARIGRAESSP